MAIWLRFLVTCIVLALVIVSSQSSNQPTPKAISDLKELVVKGLGIPSERVSGFDVGDALVGKAVTYEFQIEVGKDVYPIKLLEDITRWDFVDLPIFRPPPANEKEKRALAEISRVNHDVVSPELPSFQLAGPMELWIQNGDDVRLAIPHDVEAGTLKKVVLSDGAVVTVKGARSVSLREPLDLPLPFNRTVYKGPLASGLLNLARGLRKAARSSQKPLLSLRIDGPTSLSSTPSQSANNKLKLRLLSPGLVELSARTVPAISDVSEESEGATLWPLTSMDGSNHNLRSFEELLVSVLGKKGSEKGSFRLAKAKVSARTYVKMAFSVDQKLLNENLDMENHPTWRKEVRAHFEVIARVEDGGMVVPERIAQVNPFGVQETVSHNLQTGSNSTMSSMPILHPPPNYFTL